MQSDACLHIVIFARILKTIKKKSNKYPNCRLSGICGHLHYPFSMMNSNRKNTKSGSKYYKKKEKKKTGQACLDTEHILETIPEWFGTIWFQTLKCLASTRQNLGL